MWWEDTKLRLKSFKAIWNRSRLMRAVAVLAMMGVMLIIGLLATVYLVPFDETKLRNLEVSTVVSDRDGRFLRAYLSRDDRWRLPASLDRISPSMIKATIAAEDQRFYSHPGIDLLAVGRSIVLNARKGRIVSGASTISMQVAGFALDSRERTLSRKIKQAFLALQLEANWSKRDILECYLTHASYGGNVCGVEAAARRYFNKTAAELSIGESALLAGLPQSPERLRPDKHLSSALSRRDYVLNRLAKDNPLLSLDCARAKQIPINTGIYEVPVIAPHFCDIVRTLYPGDPRPQTTLQVSIQRSAEQLLDAAVRRYRRDGISNGAVVVMDIATGDVVALAGSSDYWNRFDRGQVNAAFGFRSPGSTLKPFIYAQAMDKGLLSPDETLYDVPVTIAGYSPLNFDRQFRGPVSAAKALAWSLNIPAIDVLQRLGVASFRDSLTAQDISLQVNPKGDQGLAMAIGTCSVRLIDLTRAYASLAGGGEIPDARWRTRAPVRTKRWITPEAAAGVLQMLSDHNIRSPEQVDSSLTGLKDVAWKTGTSNGFRDAWTFAVTSKYAVGVWIGNMDGKPSQALVGGKVAAPVALALASTLRNGVPPAWSFKETSMEIATLCKESGLPAGEKCTNRTAGHMLKGGISARTCGVHRKVEVDQVSGFGLCTRCSPGHAGIIRNCAHFPAEFASWLRANSHPWVSQLSPPHNPDCATARLGDPPAIVSPQVGKQVILVNDLPADFQKISLAARTSNPADQLYWFVNGTLAGTSPAYEPLQILPKAGTYTIRCLDERGRSSTTWFSVNPSTLVEKQVGWSRLSDSN